MKQTPAIDWGAANVGGKLLQLGQADNGIEVATNEGRQLVSFPER